MTKSTRRKWLGTALTLSVVTVVVITQGNACTNQFKEAGVGSEPSSPTDLASTTDTGSNSGSATLSSPNDLKVIPGTKTVSMVYSKQVLDQMTSCLGVQQVSDGTLSMYEQKKGAISTYGQANAITSPMMMAVISVAGEVCNDLLAQEIKGPKRIFTGFDLTSNNVPSSTAIQDAISRLSLSCWQRQETTNERQVLSSLVTTSIAANEAGANRKSALLLCTSMLSSLDALLN